MNPKQSSGLGGVSLTATDENTRGLEMQQSAYNLRKTARRRLALPARVHAELQTSGTPLKPQTSKATPQQLSVSQSLNTTDSRRDHSKRRRLLGMPSTEAASSSAPDAQPKQMRAESETHDTGIDTERREPSVRDSAQVHEGTRLHNATSQGQIPSTHTTCHGHGGMSSLLVNHDQRDAKTHLHHGVRVLQRAPQPQGHARERSQQVMADFGQTDFGQFFDRLWPMVSLTDFGQTDFGQF